MRRWFVVLTFLTCVALPEGSGSFAGQVDQQLLQALIAKVVQNTGELYVVDVRSKAEYLAGTVPGAISVPSDPAGFIADGRGGAAMLVVGADIDPARLKQWRDRLEAFGFSPVYHIEGGFEAWVQSNGPVEQPADVYVKPGTLPFIIPRGICEMNTPSQVFE